MPSDFGLTQIVNTPLESPLDAAADAQGNMYILEGEGYVNILDPQGKYLRQISIDHSDPNQPKNGGNSLILDADGNMYILYPLTNQVRKFNATGQLQLVFSTAGPYPDFVDHPYGLARDPAGNLYVINQRNLRKFNAQGVPQWAYTLGSDERALPCAVAADLAGNVFLLQDNQALSRMDPATGQVAQIILPAHNDQQLVKSYLVFDPAGNFYLNAGGWGLSKFSLQGTLLSRVGISILSGAGRITFDPNGNLYALNYPDIFYAPVADQAKLYKFNPDGQLLNRWGNVAILDCLAQDRAGNVCVLDIRKYQVIKQDATGKELFRIGSYGNTGGKFHASLTGVAFDSQNNIYALENDNDSIRVQKFSPQGAFINLITYPHPTGNTTWMKSIAVDPLGNIYVADYYDCTVYKLDQQSRLLLKFGGYGTQPGQLLQPSGLAVDGRGFVYVADRNGRRVQKFSSKGQFLRLNETPAPANETRDAMVGLSVDAFGTVFLSNSNDNLIRVYDPSGQFLRELPNLFSYVGHVSVNREGTRLLVTEQYSDIISSYAATTPRSTHVAQLHGHIFHDRDLSCEAKGPGLADIVVVAEPGNYYGVSDENGNYTIEADTGRYTVRQLLPDEPGRSIHQTCTTATSVHLSTYDTLVPGPDFGDQVTLAPYLSIRVGSSRRRRCFRNTTSISYANTGFVAAPGAKVALKLPQYVVLVSASAPYTRDAQGNYVFAVGDLAPQQHGQITVLDSVVCGNDAIRGLTVCTKAWITPGNTYPPPAAWNGGSVAVRGQVADKQVRFALVNKSKTATGDSLGLRLYTDARLAFNQKYALAAGDSLVLRVPAAAGQALRLEADQPANYPLGALATATVQAGAPATGQPNPAALMLPPATTAPTEAEDCQPIRDSYDPNDKQVLPTGTGPEHYTPTGAALSYQIRFQNTGTDAAYRVEVVDTLSAYLDLSTLRVGAASHPYRLSVSGKGRPVLTFTFDGIDLPEKARSDAGSQGFIQFSIAPKAGLGAKAKIENQAAIYFDFNNPVLTNATINRIFDVLPVVAPADALALASLIVSPQLTSFSPVQGRAGTLILISGQHFNPQADANQVSFNGVPALVLSSTTSTLTVRVPVGTASGQIRVLTADGGARSSTDFVVFQPPLLTATSADDTTPGATLRLTGTGFSAVAAQDTVTFGEAPTVVLAATTTELTVQVPATAPEMSEVRVATLGGTATLARLVRIWQKPVVSTLAPAKGKAGDLLTLTGLNFAETAGRSEVRLGPALAEITAATATRLTVRVPVGSQSGPVRVRTPGGEAWSAQTYTFVPAPLPLQFVPAAGSVGTEVTLSGENFNLDGQADSVYFAGAAAKVLSASPTKLQVLVPRGARSGPLLVAGAGGRTASKAGFEVLTLLPDEALALYPNPAPGGAATLDWRRAAFSVTQVRVFDSRGGLVLSYAPAAAADTLALPLAGRSPGLYLVLVQTSQGLVRKRLTVQ